MKKKAIKILIFLVCLYIVWISLGLFYVYKVPIETFFFVTVKSETSEEMIENMRENLNGYYRNIYDTVGMEGYTDYVIGVNAPLMDILAYDNITDNPDVVDILYEWELKFLSSLEHEM